MICPIKKYGNEYNEIPVKVSVNIRAIVTAGLAKDVEDVNQYPAVMNKATPNATDSLSFFLINNIVITRPEVAIISLTKRGISPLIF
jgi:hypothetical protein